MGRGKEHVRIVRVSAVLPKNKINDLIQALRYIPSFLIVKLPAASLWRPLRIHQTLSFSSQSEI